VRSGALLHLIAFIIKAKRRFFGVILTAGWNQDIIRCIDCIGKQQAVPRRLCVNKNVIVLITHLIEEIVQEIPHTGNLPRISVLQALCIANQQFNALIDSRRLRIARDHIHIFILRFHNKVSRLAMIQEPVEKIIECLAVEFIVCDAQAAAECFGEISLRISIHAKNFFPLIAHQVGKIGGRYGFTRAALFNGNCNNFCRH